MSHVCHVIHSFSGHAQAPTPTQGGIVTLDAGAIEHVKKDRKKTVL